MWTFWQASLPHSVLYSSQRIHCYHFWRRFHKNQITFIRWNPSPDGASDANSLASAPALSQQFPFGDTNWSDSHASPAGVQALFLAWDRKLQRTAWQTAHNFLHCVLGCHWKLPLATQLSWHPDSTSEGITLTMAVLLHSIINLYTLQKLVTSEEIHPQFRMWIPMPAEFISKHPISGCRTVIFKTFQG